MPKSHNEWIREQAKAYASSQKFVQGPDISVELGIAFAAGMRHTRFRPIAELDHEAAVGKPFLFYRGDGPDVGVLARFFVGFGDSFHVYRATHFMPLDSELLHGE